MKKLQHLAIYLPSLRGGGAERIMVTLANSFAALGHSVDLVLVKAEGPYLDEVSEAVRVIDLNRARVLASLPSLVRYLRRERPDAMLAALNHANVTAIVARALAGVRTRLVVSERCNPSGYPRRGMTRVVYALMSHLYPMANKVVAISSGVAAELVSDFGISSSHIAVVPNPVDADRIARLAQERPPHRWLQPGEPPVVLAVGRLVPEKDYQTLLDAFAVLLRDRNARLVILGEGPMRSDLEAQVSRLELEGKVEFAGFKRNPFGWMAACSAYVLTSKTEAFGNTLVEALACGARTVSTDCPSGPGEILERGRWGRLVPVGDVPALAKAIGAALDDPAPPDGAVRAKDFSVERAVASYMDAFGLESAQA